jgi:chemotaxis signal transduction protein
VTYLTFRVARQEFAMDAARVRALIPPHQMTKLEVAHPWLLGFAPAQGRDVPVVDLRAKLGLAPGSHGRLPIVVDRRSWRESAGGVYCGSGFRDG